MTMTIPLLRGGTRIVELLASLERAGSADRVVDVIDAVMVQLAFERAALHALSAHGHSDAHVHALAHARARSALFRLVTSPHGSLVFRQAAAQLIDAFKDRPCALACSLLARLDDPERQSLAEHLNRLAKRLDHPKRATREVARAVERCERSLDTTVRLGAA
jgi:hypothetical protein